MPGVWRERPVDDADQRPGLAGAGPVAGPRGPTPAHSHARGPLPGVRARSLLRHSIGHGPGEVVEGMGHRAPRAPRPTQPGRHTMIPRLKVPGRPGG